MAGSKAQRAAIWAIGVVVAIGVIAVGGWFFVVHEMKQRIVETLGPFGSVEEIDVGLSQITLSRVRLRGPAGLADRRRDARRAHRARTRHARGAAQPCASAQCERRQLLSFDLPLSRRPRAHAAEPAAIGARSRRQAQRRSHETRERGKAHRPRLVRARHDGVLRCIGADATVSRADRRFARDQYRSHPPSRAHRPHDALDDGVDQGSVAHGRGELRRLDGDRDEGLADALDACAASTSRRSIPIC